MTNEIFVEFKGIIEGVGIDKHLNLLDEKNASIKVFNCDSISLSSENEPYIFIAANDTLLEKITNSNGNHPAWENISLFLISVATELAREKKSREINLSFKARHSIYTEFNFYINNLDQPALLQAIDSIIPYIKAKINIPIPETYRLTFSNGMWSM